MRSIIISFLLCVVTCTTHAQSAKNKISASAETLAVQGNTRMTTYYDETNKRGFYLVWDIKTGKSIQYSWDGNSKSWKAFSQNITDKPLPGALGNIMFDVYYDQKDLRAYYLVWDTKTGKSLQYYWNSTDNLWDVFKNNLPENPLLGATGEIMMKAYYDTGDKRAYYLVYDTNGGKSLQYYWNSETQKWDIFTINLPEKPME